MGFFKIINTIPALIVRGIGFGDDNVKKKEDSDEEDSDEDDSDEEEDSEGGDDEDSDNDEDQRFVVVDHAHETVRMRGQILRDNIMEMMPA